MGLLAAVFPFFSWWCSRAEPEPENQKIRYGGICVSPTRPASYLVEASSVWKVRAQDLIFSTPSSTSFGIISGLSVPLIAQSEQRRRRRKGFSNQANKKLDGKIRCLPSSLGRHADSHISLEQFYFLNAKEQLFNLPFFWQKMKQVQFKQILKGIFYCPWFTRARFANAEIKTKLPPPLCIRGEFDWFPPNSISRIVKKSPCFPIANSCSSRMRREERWHFATWDWNLRCFFINRALFYFWLKIKKTIQL